MTISPSPARRRTTPAKPRRRGSADPRHSLSDPASPAAEHPLSDPALAEPRHSLSDPPDPAAEYSPFDSALAEPRHSLSDASGAEAGRSPTDPGAAEAGPSVPDLAVPGPRHSEPVAGPRDSVADRAGLVAELAGLLPVDEVHNRADAIGAIQALGVDDRAARERYGATSVTGLGDSVLTHLRFRHAASGFRRGCRRAPVRRYYLGAALLRCGLYLGPLSVAVAAAGPLRQVAWPVPLITLLLGWTAAQALTSTGVVAARRGGPAAAARLVGGGFAAVAGLWSALVWVAPAALLGPHRVLALVIGLGGLTSLATVTAAVVTRAEAAIVRWSLPCWVLAGLGLAGLAGVVPPLPLPIDTLLPAAIVVAAVRAFRPLLLPGQPGRRTRLSRAEIRRGGGFLIIGASQAACVGLLWRAGPSGSTMPFWLPLLLAVPILEALIGWHTDQVDAGLDTTETGADYGRHVRGVTLITLAGLLPPLAVGSALAVAAYRMPAELAALQGTRAGVLELAGGTLLGGVFAITFLLAARTRTGVAATVAATPPLAVAASAILPVPSAGALPDAVIVLAATHATGLLVVALTAGLRRSR